MEYENLLDIIQKDAIIIHYVIDNILDLDLIRLYQENIILCLKRGGIMLEIVPKILILVIEILVSHGLIADMFNFWVRELRNQLYILIY